MVGTVGFLVDAGTLQALVVGADINPYSARIVSFLGAASATWWMNRHYTFQASLKPTHAEWLRYVGFMVLGALVNYGAFVLCIAFWALAHTHLWLAVAIGSAAGLGVTFTTSRLLFRESDSDMRNKPRSET